MATMQEAEETIKARHILVKALRAQCFNVEEERKFQYKKLGETEYSQYTADIYASIHFIIELDPVSAHGGDHRTRKDEQRDKTIFNDNGDLRTIRLQPADVLKDHTLELTFKEMLSQLKQYQNDNIRRQ